MKTHLTASALIVLAARALAQSGAEKHGANFVSGMAGGAREFIMRAAQCHLLEIEASKLALERSDREKTRRFARRMIEDHTGSLSELERVVCGSAIAAALPSGLDDARRDALDKLAKLEGRDFEKEYGDLQLSVHREAVSLFEGYGEAGDDVDLRAFAGRALRRLHDHLTLAQNLK